MIVKPGDTIRFVAFFQASNGAGVSGIGVTVAVNEGVTNRVSVASNTAATQLDATNQPGWYYYDHVVTAGFYGIVAATFRTNSTSVTAINQPSIYISTNWIERIDASISSRLAAASYTAPTDPLGVAVPGAYSPGTAGYMLGQLSTGLVYISSPVASGGLELTLIAGDGYYFSRGRALIWTQPADSTAWGDLTGAAVTLSIAVQGTEINATGVVVVATGTGKQVRFDLTAAQTAQFSRYASRYEPAIGLFDVRAVPPTPTEPETLARGVVRIYKQV